MKKILSLSLLSIAGMLLPLRAQAQVLCALGPVTPYDPMADMPPSAGAKADLTKVTSLLCSKGCGKVLLFANATTPNTATVTDGAGVSKISYSPSFASSVRSNFGPIAMFGIFAHDLGHHLDATGTKAAWMKDSWDSELRADAWAGCAIAKADMSPSRLQAVLLAMSTYPSPHHPAWDARRSVITEGFSRCGGRMLPPLAKEKPEQAAKIDGRRDDTVSEGAPAGCSGDKDCRNGRACVDSRCAIAPERRRCGKDTDCPDPQECDASGTCSGPAGQARAEREPEGRAEAARADAGGAAGTALDGGGSPPRRTSRRAGKRATTSATSASRPRRTRPTGASPRFSPIPATRRAGVRTIPAGNVGCYHVCAGAYQRGNNCSSATLVKDCKTDGDRCRAQCE